MSEGLEQLKAAIDAVLALDPDTVTDTELDEMMIGLQQQRNRLGAVAARLLARWDARHVWATDQSRSPGHPAGSGHQLFHHHRPCRVAPGPPVAGDAGYCGCGR